MAKIFNINQYKPKKNDEFLFDTNVWIYITIPGLSYDERLPQIYSNLFGSIRSSKAKILTSFVIISEFVNRYLRNELKKYNFKHNSDISYKEFKKKTEYENGYKYISNIVNNVILKNSEILTTPSEIIEQDSKVYNYNENCDLNDNYIIELSKYYECFLVSSDRFMANVPVDINVLYA